MLGTYQVSSEEQNGKLAQMSDTKYIFPLLSLPKLHLLMQFVVNFTIFLPMPQALDYMEWVA